MKGMGMIMIMFMIMVNGQWLITKDLLNITVMF